MLGKKIVLSMPHLNNQVLHFVRCPQPCHVVTNKCTVPQSSFPPVYLWVSGEEGIFTFCNPRINLFPTSIGQGKNLTKLISSNSILENAEKHKIHQTPMSKNLHFPINKGTIIILINWFLSRFLKIHCT